MFRLGETTIVGEGAKLLGNPLIRIIDRHRDTRAYTVLEAGRSLTEFKEFKWDDVITEANSAVKAWA